MKHSSHITSASWHLLLCKPNQNHIAFRNLKNLGFDVFMPRHRVDRRWRGRVRQELRPVFAGYMFLATDPSWPRWHKARTAPGVSKLIGYGENGPASVPPEVVAGLMSRCDQDGLLQPAADDLSVGDTVRVISGPFYDFVTSIEQIDPDRRLHVLLELLGRPTRVQLDPAMVMKQGT
ncbi:MAG: transcription termination/antitermination protein NusG [Rhodovulum sp.]